MREPFGKVYSSIEKIKIPKGTRLITIGDVTSHSSILSGLSPDIIVYDGKERRNFIQPDTHEVLEKFPGEKIIIHNPPGHITEDLWNCAKKYSNESKIRIFVIGEEDLAVIPFVIESPKNTVILYGNFEEGIVLVEVNENIKNKCKQLLSL